MMIVPSFQGEDDIQIVSQVTKRFEPGSDLQAFAFNSYL